MKRYVTEFLGTFFLVLTIGLTVLGKSTFAPLAIGASLMIMVYMGGHISGAHYNPAVSLAVFLRGKLPPKDLVPYWIAQIAGALVAGLTYCIVMHGLVLTPGTSPIGGTFPIEPGASVNAFQALLVEFLFTFALALVVLNSATSPHTAGNSFYGLAIGFTVVVAAFAGGGISGGAFNPAVGIGITLVHAIKGGGTLAHVWLYIVGPLAGGAVAAFVYRMQHAQDAVLTPGETQDPAEEMEMAKKG